MTKTIVRTLARASVPALLLGALVSGPTPTTHAQTSLDQVPADMRRLMIFAPDPRKLSYLEAPGFRQLLFQREEHQEDRKFCNHWRGNRAIVAVEDHASPAVAHQQFEVARLQREKIAQFGKVASSLAGTDETAVFEGNNLSKDNCGTFQRETVFRIGKWKVFLIEDYFNGAPVTPSIAPRLVAALNGEQPLPPGEIAFRNVLFRTGLKLAGDTARSCLDEVMNTAEAAAAKDPKMADDLARLRKAAAGAHAIEVLAAVPVGPAHFDDFDPKWWDALKEVVPNPTSTPDPQDTATDRVIDLLPPPFNVLVNIVRTGSKTMRAIKTHVADPTVHRDVYACYRRKRAGPGGTPIAENIGQEALESEAAQILHDAIGAGCTAPNSFKNSYEAQLKGFVTKEAREQEFTRLLRPLAVRFEFIYRVEDAKERRETLVADRWAPVQDILARLKGRVKACIAERISKSR